MDAPNGANRGRRQVSETARVSVVSLCVITPQMRIVLRRPAFPILAPGLPTKSHAFKQAAQLKRQAKCCTLSCNSRHIVSVQTPRRSFRGGEPVHTLSRTADVSVPQAGQHSKSQLGCSGARLQRGVMRSQFRSGLEGAVVEPIPVRLPWLVAAPENGMVAESEMRFQRSFLSACTLQWQSGAGL